MKVGSFYIARSVIYIALTTVNNFPDESDLEVLKEHTWSLNHSVNQFGVLLFANELCFQNKKCKKKSKKKKKKKKKKNNNFVVPCKIIHY